MSLFVLHQSCRRLYLFPTSFALVQRLFRLRVIFPVVLVQTDFRREPPSTSVALVQVLVQVKLDVLEDGQTVELCVATEYVAGLRVYFFHVVH